MGRRGGVFYGCGRLKGVEGVIRSGFGMGGDVGGVLGGGGGGGDKEWGRGFGGWGGDVDVV